MNDKTEADCFSLVLGDTMNESRELFNLLVDFLYWLNRFVEVRVPLIGVGGLFGLLSFFETIVTDLGRELSTDWVKLGFDKERFISLAVGLVTVGVF